MNILLLDEVRKSQVRKKTNNIYQLIRALIKSQLKAARWNLKGSLKFQREVGSKISFWRGEEEGVGVLRLSPAGLQSECETK